MRLLMLLLLASVSFSVGPAFAQDADNNGIAGDEPYLPPEYYNGPVVLSGTQVIFPASSDNLTVAHFPYWWTVGDNVKGSRTIAEAQVTSASISLPLTYSILGCDTADFAFLINGKVVGTFQVTREDGFGPIQRAFGPFPVIASNSGHYDVELRLTRSVVTGCGSVSLDLAGGARVELSGPVLPTVASTWGRLRSQFR